jgi:putative ABC transport system substrate-binding protein
MVRSGADALIGLVGPASRSERFNMLNLVQKTGVPSMFEWRFFVDGEEGGLVSYGPNVPDIFRRVSIYVDKILKGAKPAELPIEQPTQFDLTVNLKAAMALGLTVPPSVLAQATEVIQ